MRYVFAAAAMFAALPVYAADLAMTFAARPAAFRAAMSPDGTEVVYLGAYKTGGRAVVRANIATGKTNIVFASADQTIAPQWCAYKSTTRLICGVYGIVGAGKEMQDFTRIIAVDGDGKNVQMIGQNTGARASVVFGGGYVLNWLPDDPDHVIMQVSTGESDTRDTNIKAAVPGTAAALVDINKGTRRIIERSNPIVRLLGADNQGNVRLRGIVDDRDGYVMNSMGYFVRPKGSSDWKPVGKAVLSDNSAMSFDGFDDGGDNLYQLKLLDGRQALCTLPTDGSSAATLVYANPKVDVDGVLRIGKYNRAVAATYTIEEAEYVFFDPQLKALTRSLSKALPATPNVAVLDESWDGTKKLVYADSGNTPGRYYLFDATTKKLGELFATMPQFDGVALGSVSAVTYAAKDGTIIPGYLTLPPGKTSAKGLPAMVMPHGGPSARDSGGFDWLAQFFAASGYAVLQPNFRGSSGYGEAFFAKNGYQAWPLAIGDINDGARWLVSQGVDPKKLVAFGWSYGGYAVLQANVVEPGLYRATVAVAPVTDLPLKRQLALGYSNYKLVDAQIGTGPHVVLGSPARQADKITAPILMFHADKDLNVDIQHSRLMASALRSAGKRYELIEYKGLDHQIDDSEARRDMLSRSAAFLAAALN